MIQRVGLLLVQLGGIAVVIGFIMMKFPQLFSALGRLPGDININNRVHILLGTSIVLSIILTGVSLLISFFARFLK